jgi:hypothetical protein
VCGKEKVMTMPATPSLDTLVDQDVRFAELEARLVDEYGADRRAMVRSTLEQERHRFDHASIHAFVPILVERSARSRLGRMSER